jgi:hypothetical protein
MRKNFCDKIFSFLENSSRQLTYSVRRTDEVAIEAKTKKNEAEVLKHEARKSSPRPPRQGFEAIIIPIEPNILLVSTPEGVF